MRVLEAIMNSRYSHVPRWYWSDHDTYQNYVCNFSISRDHCNYPHFAHADCLPFLNSLRLSRGRHVKIAVYSSLHVFFCPLSHCHEFHHTKPHHSLLRSHHSQVFSYNGVTRITWSRKVHDKFKYRQQPLYRGRYQRRSCAASNAAVISSMAMLRHTFHNDDKSSRSYSVRSVTTSTVM
jgi:hypothetical protein